MLSQTEVQWRIFKPEDVVTQKNAIHLVQILQSLSYKVFFIFLSKFYVFIVRSHYPAELYLHKMFQKKLPTFKLK